MLDPVTFAAAIAAAVASVVSGTPVASDAPVLPTPIAHAVPVEEAPVDLNPLGIDGWDGQVTREGNTYSRGWITSPATGRLVCVTAAPCEQDAHYRGAIDSSYNWHTGEEN